MFDIYTDRDVRAVQALHAALYRRDPASIPVVRWLEAQARTLVEGHGRGDPAVAIQLRNGAPGLARLDAEQILARELTEETARRAVAREHGFTAWDAVTRLGDRHPDPGFESTLDTLLAGDLDGLRARIGADPQTVSARSVYGHGATLLHYLAANGVEIRRQVVPTNAPRLAVVLLEAGADVDARARVYGGEFDTLALLESSAHPRAAGVAGDLRHVLLAAGR